MRYLPLLVILAVAGVSAGQTAGYAAGNDGSKYRVGDRLQQKRPAADAKKHYQEVGWNALVPEGWNPMEAFKGINLAMLTDADPRAIKALEKLREVWNNAPVEHGWNGQKIRIPGFVVPLERSQDLVREFLLVPYFGACIHTPPPPANQIIHVIPDKPVKMNTMDAVWVIGVLRTKPTAAEKEYDKRMGMGTAGYRMTGELVTPYRER
jgi:uncharacterized protein